MKANVVVAVAIAAQAATMACDGSPTGGDDNDRQVQMPTPDRSHVQIIDGNVPPGLVDPVAISAYQRGYAHMRATAWFSATTAYAEAVRIQPNIDGLYEVRGTPRMYSVRHAEALADYSQAIDLDPADAGLWRRRAHAHTTAPTPQPEKGVQDATRAIELDPTHHMGYGHRAMAYTQLLTPNWENALADMDLHIELFPGHDPEAYRFRALIHANLGSRAEAELGRRPAH